MISTDFIYGHRFRDIGARYGYEYVKTDYLDQHVAALHEPKRLICHNSCWSVTGAPLAKMNQDVSNLPESVGTLYSTNVDIEHLRVTPIPLGLENPGWHPENMELLRREMSKDIRKSGLLYMNYSPRTRERTELMELLGKQVWVTLRHKTDYATYLSEMNAHRFILCPEGHGMDTHRMWEALYLGSIPVVRSRVFTREFAKILPIVVLDDLKTVTKDLLEKKFREMSITSMDALGFSWWARAL